MWLPLITCWAIVATLIAGWSLHHTRMVSDEWADLMEQNKRLRATMRRIR